MARSRRIGFLSQAAWTFFFGVCLQSMTHAQRPDPSEWKWVNPDIADGCQHATLHSESMNREIGFSIYLPPSYQTSPKTRYPVVYYLHGASGSESSSKEFAWAVRQAIREGVIGDVIYVFPNGGHYSGYRDWDDGNVKAETWIIRELIPHIDATYRTISKREGRALCGWSMGGGGSLRFLTKYPDQFCAAATLGAALGTRGIRPENTAMQQLSKNLEQLRNKVGIWMAVGEDDFLRSGNEALDQKLTELNVDHVFHILPKTGHNLGEMSAAYHREMVTTLAKHYAPSSEE